MNSKYLLLLSLPVALVTAAASADTVIHFNTNAPGSPERMTIKGQKVLISAPKSHGRFIMDTASEKMLVINDADKKYFEIDSNTVEQTASMMGMMRNVMQAQLQNLPPEQRKVMEERLGLKPESKPPVPKVEIKPGKSTIKVNGVACTPTEIFTDGKKSAEACVATPKAAGIPKKDYDTMQRMFHISRKMAEKASSMSSGTTGRLAKSIAPDLPGIPMQVRDLNSDNQVMITRIETKTLSNGEFIPGQGYQKFNPLQEMQKYLQPPK